MESVQTFDLFRGNCSARLTTLLLLLALVAIPHVSSASVPQSINYQGYLTDAAGTPLNSSVHLTFSLYDALNAVQPLWSESHVAAQVTNGVYSVVLGSVEPSGNPLNLSFDRQYYLGIRVNGGEEMTPRQALSGVPYALAAKQADNIGTPCPDDSVLVYRNGWKCGNFSPLPYASGICVQSVCEVSGCSLGHGNCDGNALNGCEADLMSSLESCGSCSNSCSIVANASAACMSGACSVVCNPGYADCDSNMADGCETNISGDLQNCGSCGNTCSNAANASIACNSGACAITSCDTGYANCNSQYADGCEADLSSNDQNCGSCGHACAVNEHCSAGTCAAFCNMKINEFLPGVDGTYMRQFVELYNSCDFAFDITNWKLKRSNDSFIMVALGDVVAPHSYYVAWSPEYGSSYGGVAEYEWGVSQNFTSNGLGGILLVNPSGYVIDTLYWNEAVPGVSAAFPGQSLSRTPDGWDTNNDASDFILKTATIHATNDSCIDDSGCGIGRPCRNGVCTPLSANGIACSTGTDCLTGNCVQGESGMLCSAMASCGACMIADAGGAACVAEAVGQDIKNECGGSGCDGSGSCSTCVTDANCDATHFCSGGACTPKFFNGTSCSSGSQCVSANCIQGASGNICSSMSSCGTCQVADASGTSCIAEAAGLDIRNECGLLYCNGTGACSASCAIDPDCKAGNFCNNGTCAAKLANGTSCGSGNECASGNCVQGESGMLCSAVASCGTCTVVDATGATCVPETAGLDLKSECGGSGCDGSGSCSTCVTGANCDATHFCSGGTCATKFSNGTSCSSGNECVSANCIEGASGNICSAMASCGTCMIADANGTVCVADAAGQDIKNECGAFYCDGSGACAALCADDSACKPGNFCNSGACTPKLSLGAPCAAGTSCQSNICALGMSGNICSSISACGTCMVVDAGGTSCIAEPSGFDIRNECGGAGCNGAGACSGCVSDANCPGGQFCPYVGGTCTARYANGTPCGSNNECSSGYCTMSMTGTVCGVVPDCGSCQVISPTGTYCEFVPYGEDPNFNCSGDGCDGNGNCI